MNLNRLIKGRKNNSFSFNSNSSSIDSILKKSTSAVCGTFEREVVVESSGVGSTKALLRKRGFIIVGTGPAGPSSTKIWFNPAGASL